MHSAFNVLNRFAKLNMSNNTWDFEPSQSDIKSLREWLKKMPHVVQDYDDRFLAAFVRGCKGSLQKTKIVLENFNALGFRYPYLLDNLDPLHPKLQEYLSVIHVFPLPKRLEDGTIVVAAVRNFAEDDLSKFHSLEVIRYFIQWFYIFLWEDDYGPGKIVLIFDSRGISVSNVREVTPVVSKDLSRILQNSMPVRVKGIHFVNLAPTFATICNLIKSLCPEKLSHRIHFHSSMDTLFEHVPKQILPKDYGDGSAENVVTLFTQWKNKVESYREKYIEENLKMRKFDSIRPKSNDMDNTSATFTKLNID